VTGVVLAARLLLLVVLGVAGLAKLADLPGSRHAALDFGVPGRLAAPVAVGLPLVELIIAAGLVPAATAWPAALTASVLLLVFTAAITVSVLRGRHPQCHCFGQLHSAPVGWPAVVRNLLLVVVTAVVVARGPSGAGPALWRVGRPDAVAVSMAVAVAALLAALGAGWWALQLTRQQGRLLLRIDALEGAHTGVPAPAALPPLQGLPLGAPAPAFALPDLDGAVTSSEELLSDRRPTLLVFTDPGCGPCTALLPDVGRWQRELADRLSLVVISSGSAEANRQKTDDAGLHRVLLQTQHEVADAFRSPGTPTAVLVTPDGTIGSRLAPGADQVRQLVIDTARHGADHGVDGRELLPLEHVSQL